MDFVPKRANLLSEQHDQASISGIRGVHNRHHSCVRVESIHHIVTPPSVTIECNRWKLNP
eukprot:788274-Amorphochlora_amoeboformis.AAC.1